MTLYHKLSLFYIRIIEIEISEVDSVDAVSKHFKGDLLTRPRCWNTQPLTPSDPYGAVYAHAPDMEVLRVYPFFYFLRIESIGESMIRRRCFCSQYIMGPLLIVLSYKSIELSLFDLK